MIVRVFKTHPAGTGRPLTTYVLAAKHENTGERLGSYIRDPTKDKIAWDRTVNCGVDDPFQAIGAIERYNARNTRWHKKSRWEHIVVSFPDGERPTRSRMESIEDRLMASIGFGDHPRISAVHHDTLHSHLHIAVSRIDPTTLHAEHPHRNRYLLQAEAARLEIDLGLRQERKTLLSREREEIDSRRSLDRAITAHHRPRDETTPDLEREMRGYFDALGRRGAEAAEAAGVTRDAIMSGLVGVVRIRPVGTLWEPDENGTVAFVTPVRVHPGNAANDIESTDPARAVRKGEIVDLIAWHPSRPDTWVLRTGEAAALGAVQYRLSDEAAEEPSQVHDSPLAWLRAGGTGIVAVTSDPIERRLILGLAGSVDDGTASVQVDTDGIAELDRRAPPAQLNTERREIANPAINDARRAELEKASWADKVQSGLRPLMIEDMARILEPKYAALIKRASELRELAAEAERSRDRMELNKDAAAYRIAERRAEIGVLGRAAHWIGTAVPKLNILRDLELHRWERMQGGAAYMEDNKGIKLGAAKGELDKVTRLAEQMLDPNHPIGQTLRPSGLTLRQEAERELQHRQEIARNAREILVNAQRATINRRRSHSLRSGP